MTAPKTPPPLQYTVTDHICRICMGRVLTRTTFDDRKVYRCSNCGTEVEGNDAHALCCCGIKLRNKKDAGIRCRINDNRRPENPSQVIAEQVSVQNITRS